MQNLTHLFLVTAVAALALHATADVQAQQAAMTFSSPASALARERIWVAWRAPTDTARRWRRRSVRPVTGRGTPT